MGEKKMKNLPWTVSKKQLIGLKNHLSLGMKLKLKKEKNRKGKPKNTMLSGEAHVMTFKRVYSTLTRMGNICSLTKSRWRHCF